jgi:hypothetical protein
VAARPGQARAYVCTTAPVSNTRVLSRRRRNSDPRLRQFIGVARNILRAARASDQPSAPIARSTRHPRLDDDSGAA